MSPNLHSIFRMVFARLRQVKAEPAAWARAREWARTAYAEIKHQREKLDAADAKRLRRITARAMNRIKS